MLHVGTVRVAGRFAGLALSALLALGGCSDGDSQRDGIAANTVTLANLNILHGFDCDPPTPGDGDQCRVRERIALLREHLLARDCPDLVTLQEVVNREYLLRSPTEQVGPLESIVALLEAELPVLAAGCGFSYQLVYQPFLEVLTSETDEELILSRYPVLHTGTQVLHNALYDIPNGFQLFARHVLHVRIDHPAGEVDVYTTHLSSGSDAGANNCNSFRELVPGTDIGPRVPCPAECDSDDTVRACQAQQMALYVEQSRGAQNLALIAGDFNAEPGSSEYLAMTGRGWLDSHLAAGQPECESATGLGCTSGRDSRLHDLESPSLNVDRRIDYIFIALPEGAGNCVISPADNERGMYTLSDAGLFAAEPNPFSDACGSIPGPVCWVSDHSGNHARLTCRRNAR